MTEAEIAAIAARQWPYVLAAYAVVTALVWGYAARLWASHRAIDRRAAAQGLAGRDGRA